MQKTPNAADLFASAQSVGALSPNSAMVLNGVDLTAGINDALGVPVDTLQGSETLAILIIVDDSGSIADFGNTKNVIDGVDLILDSVIESKSVGDCLACIMSLNTGLIAPFTPIEQVTRLSTKNYRPSGGTPLYDRCVEGLGAMLAKVEECRQNGVPARGITVFVTDGDNNASRRTSDDVSHLADDLKRTEAHIIAGIGIDDGKTDFKAVFSSMGLRDDLILTPKNTKSEIRKAFVVVSRSSATASQGAAGFSQVLGAGLQKQP